VSETIFNQYENQLLPKWVKRPDLIKATKKNDSIYLSGEDIKTSINHCNSVEQISQFNLFDLINNSKYIQSSVEELKRIFKTDKIVLEQGSFILKNDKQKNKQKLEHLIEKYNKTNYPGTLILTDFEPYKTINETGLFHNENSYFVEMISVEQLHREIGFIKNRIKENGFYAAAIIAVSGFDNFGNGIKRFEYNHHFVNTYSPELEEIMSKIDEINTWTIKEVIEDDKNKRNSYLKTLKATKNSINSSIQKLEERIDFLLHKYPEAINRINEIEQSLEENEKRYEYLMNKYENIEKLFLKGKENNPDLNEWINVIKTLSEDFEYDKKSYQENLERLNKYKDQSSEERKKAKIDLIFDLSKIFPIFKSTKKEDLCNSKAYSILFKISKLYLMENEKLSYEKVRNHELFYEETKVSGTLEQEIEKNQKKILNYEKELNYIDKLIGEQEEEYNKVMQDFHSKNGYQKSEQYKQQLIKNHENMIKKIKGVVMSREKRLREKYEERKEFDESLNRKIQYYHNEINIETDITIEKNKFMPRILYLDIDPLRKQVAKIYMFNYKKIV
ncbi:MAG: hypothetical protein ACMXX8_02245, partial [Candidatus Woesearchaeota archaeon]